MSSDSKSPPRPPPLCPPHITVNSGLGEEAVDKSQPDRSSLSQPNSRQLVPRLGLYTTPSVAGSSEMLLPPAQARWHRPMSERPESSLSRSAISSRRTSWSSDKESRLGPYTSTSFDDYYSRASSRAGDSDDGLNTQTVSEKYNIQPSDGLLIFPEDVEKDDYLHNPGPDDKDEKCDVFSKRGMMNIGGLVLITLGVLVLFIGYPALTFYRDLVGIPDDSLCSSDPDCLSTDVSLLKNVRRSLIDEDTPDSAKTKTSNDGKTLHLVFSDEFNKDGRTFYSGDDPFFEAVDLWYGVTEDIEWYDPDAVSTSNGTLNIKFDAFQNHNLNYRSGMLQSWNKLCFKGGRIEASISLPGRGDVSGFWPGFWAMGNLGRPGYAATTEGLWPYSYWDKCDAGITANQSSADGISFLPGMRLPACTCKNQDHPSPGNSRGAPEIDALEATVAPLGDGAYEGVTGTVSQTFQVAPFDIFYEPDYNYVEVYDHAQTSMNSYRGGPYQEAFSAMTWLNNDWYDGKGYQTYGFEYTPGSSGDISWFVGDQYAWKMDQRSVRSNGNIGQRVVPEEPMSIIMNFGMSNSFSQVLLANLAQLMPATMRFDYIRIYQEDGDGSMITCDPPDYPTTEYISNHPEPYSNPNLTAWADTNYTWPKNTLVNGCT